MWAAIDGIRVAEAVVLAVTAGEMRLGATREERSALSVAELVALLYHRMSTSQGNPRWRCSPMSFARSYLQVLNQQAVCGDLRKGSCRQAGNRHSTTAAP
jgi:hypothetical protein